MIDIGLQHLVLMVLLILFYFLPTESLPRQSRGGEEGDRTP